MSKKEDEHKEGKKKRKNMTIGGIMQKNEFLFVFISICQYNGFIQESKQGFLFHIFGSCSSSNDRLYLKVGLLHSIKWF